MTLSVQFLGAAGTVTGSRYLLEDGERRVLIDFGLFQGQKELRLRNWQPLPFDARTIDAVVLTHAHIDHSGALPLLVKNGFKGPIHATGPTVDLVDRMLLDSAHIQESDAAYANRKRYSKHRPALPLYSVDDAREAITRLTGLPFDEPLSIGPITVRFHRAGHLLGAAGVLVEHEGQRVYFSGDVGRPGSILHLVPEPPLAADVLICESTYGDRNHAPVDPHARIAEEVRAAFERGGALIVPAFAIGRTQEVLLILRQLEDEHRIPELRVFSDSPMAIDGTKTYLRHARELQISPFVNFSGSEPWPQSTKFCSTVDDSKAINDVEGPCIIVTSSGMAEGGRVLHHLKRRLRDPATTVLFAGYQAAGTRGRRLVDGERQIKIHGHYLPVRATIRNVRNLSGHAGRDELLDWVASAPEPPEQIFVTHGEVHSSAALVDALEERGLLARAALDGERILIGD